MHSADYVRNDRTAVACRLVGQAVHHADIASAINSIDHARMADISQNTLTIDRQLHGGCKNAVPFVHFSTYHGIELAAMPLFTAMRQRIATQYVVP